MFFQPVSVFPVLEKYQPYQTSVVLALISYLGFGRVVNDKPFLANRYTQFFLLFVLMQIMSSSVIWLHGGLNTLITWINFIIVYYLIVKMTNSINKIESILVIIILAICYLSIYSLTDIHNNYYSGYRAKGFGWYENANDLVLILITVIPFSLYFYESTKKVVLKYLALFIVILFILNILYAGSRQGLLGLIIVCGISLLSAKKKSRVFRIGIATLLLISIITIGAPNILSREDLGGRLSGDESSEDRILQWKACLRMVRDHPLLGVGPGESVYQMRYYGGLPGLVPHNTIIQVFAETGIPGGIFFVLFSCYPIVNGLKNYKKIKLSDENTFLLYRYLMVALIGFWVCAIFSNRIQFSILYVLVALIVSVQENLVYK